MTRVEASREVVAAEESALRHENEMLSAYVEKIREETKLVQESLDQLLEAHPEEAAHAIAGWKKIEADETQGDGRARSTSREWVGVSVGVGDFPQSAPPNGDDAKKTDRPRRASVQAGGLYRGECAAVLENEREKRE